MKRGDLAITRAARLAFTFYSFLIRSQNGPDRPPVDFPEVPGASSGTRSSPMVVLVCDGVLGGVMGCWVHAFWDVLPHPGPQSPGNIARSRNELARASEQWRRHTIALCARIDVHNSGLGGGAETRRGAGRETASWLKRGS